MAEKETKNNPKDLVEPVPEEVAALEKDEVVAEELEELERSSESSEEKSTEEKSTDKRRSIEHQGDKELTWAPKTKLGKAVLAGKEKDLSNILENGKKVLEPEIVDYLLDIETDLIAIGQAKGKFGGGKRRAWRQTQKKTKEGNVLTFSSMAVVGNSEGFIGLGYGKAKETLPAREKALRKAKMGIMQIGRGFENLETEKDLSDPHTVPFKVSGKCGSVKMTLIPAPRGTGLVIGDECKKILKLAGIKDVYAVTKGHTRTTFNLAKACMSALSKTKTELKQ